MGPFQFKYHSFLCLVVIKWERNFTYLNLNSQSILALQGIKNIIFDLGGVIINLSVEKTHQAFATLSGLPLQEVKDRVHQATFFHEYEKGLINDSEFRNHLRRSLQLDVDDSQLDHAWNAMLLDIPIERIQLLERIKKNYHLYLLSNTNNIHLQSFNRQVFDLTGFPSLDQYFHNAYYSHLIKMKKPDVEIFEYVLENNNLLATETIFLDDNTDNLDGATKAGIRTFHVQQPDQIFSPF
jgi:putative hydrolase of the HAD superfamily